MTLRITLAPDEVGRTALRLEGRFTEGDLPVLEACIAGRAGAELVLDLSELRWLDAASARRIGRLVSSGARVVAISPFVERLLTGNDPGPPNGPPPGTPIG